MSAQLIIATIGSVILLLISLVFLYFGIRDKYDGGLISISKISEIYPFLSGIKTGILITEIIASIICLTILIVLIRIQV
jgi:hypothetical protein